MSSEGDAPGGSGGSVPPPGVKAAPQPRQQPSTQSAATSPAIGGSKSSKWQAGALILLGLIVAGIFLMKQGDSSGNKRFEQPNYSWTHEYPRSFHETTPDEFRPTRSLDATVGSEFTNSSDTARISVMESEPSAGQHTTLRDEFDEQVRQARAISKIVPAGAPRQVTVGGYQALEVDFKPGSDGYAEQLTVFLLTAWKLRAAVITCSARKSAADYRDACNMVKRTLKFKS